MPSWLLIWVALELSHGEGKVTLNRPTDCRSIIERNRRRRWTQGDGRRSSFEICRICTPHRSSPVGLAWFQPAETMAKSETASIVACAWSDLRTSTASHAARRSIVQATGMIRTDKIINTPLELPSYCQSFARSHELERETGHVPFRFLFPPACFEPFPLNRARAFELPVEAVQKR